METVAGRFLSLVGIRCVKCAVAFFFLIFSLYPGGWCVFFLCHRGLASRDLLRR